MSAIAGEDGVLLAFPVPPEGAAVEPEEGPRWRLSRQGQGFRLEDPAGGPTLHFAPVPGTEPGVLPLAAIEDRNRNRIEVCYDARGLLTGLRHTGGYAVGRRLHGRAGDGAAAARGRPGR